MLRVFLAAKDGQDLYPQNSCNVKLFRRPAAGLTLPADSAIGKLY